MRSFTPSPPYLIVNSPDPSGSVPAMTIYGQALCYTVLSMG